MSKYWVIQTKDETSVSIDTPGWSPVLSFDETSRRRALARYEAYRADHADQPLQLVNLYCGGATVNACTEWPKVWTRAEIEALIDKSDNAVYRALVAIYRFQTRDEQAVDATTKLNHVGFRVVDAEFLSSLAKQVLVKRSLTVNQINAARPIMKKYGRQLTDIANKKQSLSV